MKITKSQLQRTIQEVLQQVLKENGSRTPMGLGNDETWGLGGQPGQYTSTGIPVFSTVDTGLRPSHHTGPRREHGGMSRDIGINIPPPTEKFPESLPPEFPESLPPEYGDQPPVEYRMGKPDPIVWPYSGDPSPGSVHGTTVERGLYKRDVPYLHEEGKLQRIIDEEFNAVLTEQERDRYGNEVWYDDGEAIPVDPATGRDVSYGGYSGFEPGDPRLAGVASDPSMGGYTGMSEPMPGPPEETWGGFEDEQIRGDRPEPEPWRPVTPQQVGWAFAREEAERLEREAEESPQAGRQGDEETLRLP